MITLGIDSGSQNSKGIALQDGHVAARVTAATEFDAHAAAERVRDALLRRVGARAGDVASITATGTGRSVIGFADNVINEISSGVRGVLRVAPETRLLIDLGAESCRVIKLLDNGAVDNYEVNDKCASGAGTFLETMARTLQTKLEDMGPMALKHTRDVPMNAQCVVFAESEVVSLIHAKTEKEDIAWSIFTGVCNRINSMVRRVGIMDNISIIGGTAKNVGLVACMSSVLGRSVIAPEHPEFVNALGAALHAAGVSSDGATA